MITISDGILTIPEGERFVGFAGDNRHTRKKFFIRSNPESGWLYRLYLTFDDGRHNFFVLPATVSQEGTFLEWNIEEDHILKSGLVKAQIKAFSEENEVYHTTSDVFVAGKTTEEDEEFKNSNSEFLSFEKTLNELYEKMNKASAKMPYVGANGNWMCFDEKTGAYKDTGISSAVGVGDKSITPQKLDRPYWERKTVIDTQVDKVEDLFDAAGFLNSDGSIAFLNVNLTVNIGDDTVELAKINGYCYAVGVKFVSGDTVYLINVTDGTKWKINRYNEGDEYVPLYRLECMRLGLAESSVTPAQLDRTYLEKCVTQYGEVITSFRDLANKVGYINRGGNLGFVKLSVSNSENDTVNNYGYIDGEFIAVGSPSGRNVCLLNISNGETWTVSAKDDGTYYAYKVDVLTPRIENLEKNAKIVLVGMINDVSELYDYPFSKDYLYHFYATGAFGGKLVGRGYCYGRYTPVTDPETGALTGKLLEVFNSSTLKVYNLNIGEGTAELITAVSDGADGYTPVKGVDYFTDADVAEVVAQVALESATREELNRVYFDSVCAPSPQLPADGRVKGEAVGGGDKVANFTNLVASDFSNVQLNKRISSSEAVKDAVGNICFEEGFAVEGGDIIRINLPESVFSTNYSRILLYNNGSRLNSDGLPTAEGVVTLSTVDGVTSFKIPATYNGGTVALIKLNLYISDSSVTEEDIADLIITKNEEITYTEVSEVSEVSADFDVASVKSYDIHNYIDKLAEKYPNYISKENLGKDASGTYDYNRYTLCKHYWNAWRETKYVDLFAWKNGSTVIYSESVSPRVGDNMYSTKYIGTVYGTVTSVNCSAQGSPTMQASTRTVNDLVFTRYEEGDVEPVIWYTTVLDDVAVDTKLYSADGTSMAKITAINGNTITTNNTARPEFVRYPMADLNCNREKPLTVTIWANEHNDTPEPAIVMARFIKDLCENKDNPFLKYVKNNLKMVIIPVANPYGYNWQETGEKYGDGYYNVNGVNINRNFDTPGWANGPYDTGDGALGEYAGSELETQYLMNTLKLSKAVVGMSLHTVGYMDGDGVTELGTSNGLCHYQGNNFNLEKIAKIAEVMKSNYNLKFTDYGTAEPTTTGKSPAYITYAGCVGGLVEMQPREAINVQGTDGSPMVMEACYTEFLHCLYMWLTDALSLE